MCHVSRVTCHVSHITCHMSQEEKKKQVIKVISKLEDTIEVELLNNAKSKLSLNKEDVEAYRWDTKLFKNGTSELKNAYKKAKGMTDSLL